MTTLGPESPDPTHNPLLPTSAAGGEGGPAVIGGWERRVAPPVKLLAIQTTFVLQHDLRRDTRAHGHESLPHGHPPLPARCARPLSPRSAGGEGEDMTHPIPTALRYGCFPRNDALRTE